MVGKRKKQENLVQLQNDIKRITSKDGFSRRVLRTAPDSRLIVMSIPPEYETGEQNEEATDKVLFIVTGTLSLS